MLRRSLASDIGGNTGSEGEDGDQNKDNASDDGWPGWPFNDDDLSTDEEDDNDPSSGDSSPSDSMSSSDSNSSSSTSQSDLSSSDSSRSSDSTMVAETWDASQLSANGEGKPRVGGIMLEEGKLVPWVGRQTGSTVLHFSFNKTKVDNGGKDTGDWIAVHKEDEVTHTCNMKGPECPTQLRPTDMKGAQKSKI